MIKKIKKKNMKNSDGKKCITHTPNVNRIRSHCTILSRIIHENSPGEQNPHYRDTPSTGRAKKIQ